ncbi:hypothetical protein CDD83_8291 [Cordyceps sp. RAO-2017]|nr:hypothetical protein CDD83_8291 [Cordyceps sp. RAO-2017]
MDNDPALDEPPAPSADDQEILGGFRYARREALLEIRAAGGDVVGRCAVPPAAPSPDGFLPWFSAYTAAERDGARGS